MQIKRYARVGDTFCPRYGRITVEWTRVRSEWYGTCYHASLASSDAPVDELPPIDKTTLYRSALRSTSRNLVHFTTPSPITLRRIQHGDTDACQGCTYCQKFLLSCDDEAVSYSAIYAQGFIRGHARVVCTNPEVYRQDSIVWNIDFSIRYVDEPEYYHPELTITHYDIPHTHAPSSCDGPACISPTVCLAARQLYRAKEWASGTRILLEALRTLTPEDPVTSALRAHLGIAQCHRCHKFCKYTDKAICATCGQIVCPDCMHDSKTCAHCHECEELLSLDADDYTWTREGIPQGLSGDYGPIQPGTIVLLDPQNDSILEEYAGRATKVERHAGILAGYPSVTVYADRGNYLWRLRNLQIIRSENEHETENEESVVSDSQA